MFKKREAPDTMVKDQAASKTETAAKEAPPRESAPSPKINSIVKGSKLTGDITISYDLELDGDVEGNITSEQKSNIVIKGTCNGNIRTKEGNVNIAGRMSKGDIVAGGDVNIRGTFSGGKVEAKGNVYINGKFSGRIEGRDIEIGPAAEGDGELLYRENISVAKGAKIEASIKRQNKPGENKGTAAANPSDSNVVTLEKTSKKG